jgi:hypothetical protein
MVLNSMIIVFNRASAYMLSLLLCLTMSIACAVNKQAIANQETIVSPCDRTSSNCPCEPYPGVEVSDEERCLLKVICQRCNVRDGCIAKCLANGEGHHVGGSCWHNCANLAIVQDQLVVYDFYCREYYENMSCK